MKNRKNTYILSLFAVLTFWAGFSAKAQLTVTNNAPYNTASYLVTNVLLGSGVTVSNITYNGAPVAIGFFNSLNSNVGLDSGVLLTSGTIQNAIGPNNISGSTSGVNAGNSDPDLNMVCGFNTYDACILEFDFVPMADTVKFRYVFGSEEYPEYTCCTVSDPFGFFISGPGITGPYSNNSKNIAVVPVTGAQITINTLNGNCASVSYCNASNPCCGSNSTYYIDNSNATNPPSNPSPTAIQYDGFTVPMTAVSAVQCGQTYHIKIAVSDAGDQVFDSGVFLEAGSFASAGAVVGTASSGANINGNDSTVYEGCGSLVVYFDRGNDTLTQDTVFITLAGTATNGVDVNPPVPTQVIFPIGQDSVGVVINPVMDGISEGIETIQFIIIQNGACNQSIPDTVTIYIMNVDPITLQTTSDTVCPADPATLSVTPSGGMPGYQYSWSGNLGTTASITVNPLLNTTYTVYVTDTCGNQSQQTVTAYVTQPSAVLTYGFATVNTVDFNGAGSFSNIVSYSWNFGDGNTSTLQNPSHTYPNDQTYTFLVTLTVTDANGCTSTTTEVITIYPDFYFYTPNSFSPNGDGHNDYYTANGVGLQEYQLMIFNRWGELLYLTDDINKGWDGTFNGGEIVQEDVYIAVFDVLAPMNKKIHKVTHVSVIR